MTLPSNAEIAAVLRDIAGEKLAIQGSPESMASAVLAIVRLALRSTQEPARFDGEKALAEFEAKQEQADECARCTYPRKEHSYNGACYGICGGFVEAEK